MRVFLWRNFQANNSPTDQSVRRTMVRSVQRADGRRRVDGHQREVEGGSFLVKKVTANAKRGSETGGDPLRTAVRSGSLKLLRTFLEYHMMKAVGGTSPVGHCTGCIGGSHGDCKASGNHVCYPKDPFSGACPAWTAACSEIRIN